MLFTPEELAELAAADAEIEAEFRLTPEDLRRFRALDHAAALEGKDNRQRKVTERQKAYYEANKDKVAEYKKAWYQKRKAARMAEASV